MQSRYLLILLSLLVALLPCCRSKKTAFNLDQYNLIAKNGVRRIQISGSPKITREQDLHLWQIDDDFASAQLQLKTNKSYALIWEIRFDPFCGEEHYIFNTPRNDTYLFLELGALHFRTSHKGGKHDASVSFEGSGPLSYSNLFDNKFHKIGVAWNEDEKRKTISIDGQIVYDEKQTVLLSSGSVISGLETYRFFKSGGKNSKRAMSLKSISLLEGKEEVKAYVKSLQKLNAKKQILIRDAREYSSQTSALQQLMRFPIPSYNSEESSLRLYNWMGLNYLGGEKHGVPQATAVQRTVDIQLELAKNWNYYLGLGNSKVAQEPAIRDVYLKAWIRMANDHPELPLSVTTLWAQTDQRLGGDKERTSYINRKNLPGDQYLSNGKLAPWANVEWAKRDGRVQRRYLQNIMSNLKRPIEIINENGEVPPHVVKSEILSKEKSLPKELQLESLSMLNLEQARLKLNHRKAYSSQFLSLKGLEDCLFTWYNIAGGPIDAYDWNISAESMSAINKHRLSTPSFYPRWPSNWRYWKGANHGWEWVVKCRKEELKYGDAYFSPYISPGWSIKPEENIRPSQWLALLKSLSAVGAKSYYTGFFNVGEAVMAVPSTFIWQAAMPAYAQATFSWLSEFLDNSHFLQDAKGEALVTYPCSRPDVLMTLRKEAQKERYLICASIMPSSNADNNCPDNVEVAFKLRGLEYKISCRKQGSVYTLDLRDLSNPILFQHDSWHGLGHPSNWSEMLFEFELQAGNSRVRTYFKDWQQRDMTTFSTCIEAKPSFNVKFQSRLRKNQKTESIGILYKSQTEADVLVLFHGTEKRFKLPPQEEFGELSFPFKHKLDKDNPVLELRVLKGNPSLENLRLSY